MATKKKVYENKYFPTGLDSKEREAPEMPMYDPAMIQEIANKFGGGSVNPAIQQYQDLLQKIQGQDYGANSRAMIDRLGGQISGLQGQDVSGNLFGQGNKINNFVDSMRDPTGALRQAFGEQQNTLADARNLNFQDPTTELRNLNFQDPTGALRQAFGEQGRAQNEIRGTNFTDGMSAAKGQQEGYFNDLMGQDFSGELKNVLGEQRGLVNNLRGQDVTGGFDQNIEGLRDLVKETRGLRDNVNSQFSDNRGQVKDLYGNIAKTPLAFGQDYLEKAGGLVRDEMTNNAENARRMAIESMNSRGLGAGAAENVSRLRQNDLNDALAKAYATLNVNAESGRAKAMTDRDAQLAQLLGLDRNAIEGMVSNNANSQNNVLGAYNAINSAISGREGARSNQNAAITNLYGQMGSAAKGIGDLDLGKYGLGQDMRTQINNLATGITAADLQKAGLLQGGANAMGTTASAIAQGISNLNSANLGKNSAIAQGISNLNSANLGKQNLLDAITKGMATTGANIGSLMNDFDKTKISGMTAAGGFFDSGYKNDLAKQQLINQLLGQQGDISTNADKFGIQGIQDQINAINGVGGAFASDQGNNSRAIGQALGYYDKNQEGYKINREDKILENAGDWLNTKLNPQPTAQSVQQNPLPITPEPYKPLDMNSMNFQLGGVNPTPSLGFTQGSNIPANRTMTTVPDNPPVSYDPLNRKKKATTSFITQPQVYY